MRTADAWTAENLIPRFAPVKRTVLRICHVCGDIVRKRSLQRLNVAGVF